MSLRVNRVRLAAQTREGPFGTDVAFDDGLVVIRADNSQGKSTLVQAIIYALGLEGMFGPRHEVPLPPAMTDTLQTQDGREVAVDESSVVVEIANRTGDVLTCQRWAKHASLSTSLVRTWKGAALSSGNRGHEQDYFVRRPGSAQAEAGFHRLLAQFIGWQLPTLVASDGREVPLYMEFLFPLFFVEQKNGWGGIQRYMPFFAGVQGTKQRAIEYVLDLGIYERLQRRRALGAELDNLRVEYRHEVSAFRASLGTLGLVMEGIPSELPIGWPPEVTPTLKAPVGESDWVQAEERLEQLRAQLNQKRESSIPTVADSASDTSSALVRLEEDLAEASVAGSVALQELGAAQQERASLDRRIAALDEDRRRYRDALTLRQLGSSQEVQLLESDCPTCHQPWPPTLGLDDELRTMSLEDNLAFVTSQVDTFKSMRLDSERQVSATEQRLAALRTRGDELRREIRTFRQDLVSLPSLPSAASIRERLEMEDAVERLSHSVELFAGLLESIAHDVDSASGVRAEITSLELDLDDQDTAKLGELESSLRSQLHAYGFESFPVASIEISPESYHPTREGYDLGFAASASDSVRLVWAYLLGLLEVARVSETHHPGFLVFDEPRQHEAALPSFEALLGRASLAGEASQQVIFATSQPLAAVREMLHEHEHQLISFEDRLLSPLKT